MEMIEPSIEEVAKSFIDEVEAVKDLLPTKEELRGESDYFKRIKEQASE